MITPALFSAILEQYTLPVYGVHGVTHWARVLENGRRLAESTGARLDVIELFAVFHDSRRVNEIIDHFHGQRGAELAAEMRGKLFDLPDGAFNLLQIACARHTDGQTEADITVQTCWDADRLDLYRVGIRPKPGRLCTDAARDPQVLAWANDRAWRRSVPDLIGREWGLNHRGSPDTH